MELKYKERFIKLDEVSGKFTTSIGGEPKKFTTLRGAQRAIDLSLNPETGFKEFKALIEDNDDDSKLVEITVIGVRVLRPRSYSKSYAFVVKYADGRIEDLRQYATVYEATGKSRLAHAEWNAFGKLKEKTERELDTKLDKLAGKLKTIDPAEHAK